MNKKILGIDSGIVNIGLALYNTETNKVEWTEQQKVTGSLVEYCALFQCTLKDVLPTHVVCEKPYSSIDISSKGYSIVEIMAMQRLECEKLSIPWSFLSPTSVKKQFTGKGTASKNDMKAEVIKRFDLHFSSSHINDAIGIAVSWAEKDVNSRLYIN